MSDGRKRMVLPVPRDWKDNRDATAGKIYVINEWSAGRAEAWALKMFIALKGSGNEISESEARLGIVGVALAGINTFLRAAIDPAVLIPLLDEMLTCVTIIRDHARPDIESPLSSEDDIEEVPTRLWLRSEVIKLHTGFSPADALFALISALPTSSSPST